ncbi:hypothetical protein GGE65_007443 [Skermanella aerolata]
MLSCLFAGETVIASGKPYFIDREMDFDALDLLAAIEAAREACRR